MATSGSFVGNTVSDGGEYMFVTWSLVSQNIAANTSVVNWKISWKFIAYGCRGLRLGKLQIHGIVVYDDDDPGDGIHAFNAAHDHRPSLQVASGNVTLTHNSAGALTFSTSAHMTGYNGQYSQGGGTFSLPTIPQVYNAPATPTISNVSSTSFFVNWTDPGGGVGAIDFRRLVYSLTTNVNDGITIDTDGSTSVTGLDPGTTYYVWVRVHNAAGYSAWSPRASTTTFRVPDPPSTPTISNIQPTQLDVSWTPNYNGGSSITGYDLAYNTSPSTSGATIVTGVNSPYTLTGLTPGTQYYIWVRAKNVVGNSNWSNIASPQSIAGVRINSGGVWKTAVPYVRVGGIWKKARPFVKYLGVWKETT